MKPSKFLSQKLIDKLVSPLIESFKLIFLLSNYNFDDKQLIKLTNDDEFNNKFEILIRDCLKDYNNCHISHFEMTNNFKFNLGLVYTWICEYQERKCD